MTLIASLISYLPYDDQNHFGFLLPIFVAEASTRPHIQIIDDVSGKIKLFRPLSADESLPIYRLPLRTYRSGDDSVFVFASGIDMIISGTLSEIRSELEKFLVSGGLPIGILLQISELVGSNESKYKFRALFAEKLTSLSSRDNSVDSFLESLSCIDMWEKSRGTSKNRPTRDVSSREIIRNAKESPKFRDINRLSRKRGYRHKISETELSHGAKIEEFEILEGDKTVRIIWAGPWKNRSFINAVSSEISYSNVQTVFLFDQTSANTVLHSSHSHDIRIMAFDIISIRRQEERIARLLYFILNNYYFWQLALTGYYYDRGKFARSALGLIRKYLLPGPEKHGSQILEFEILRIIDQLTKTAFMEGKGRFVAAVARYMGKDPDVKLVIKQIMRRYTGRSMSLYEKEILGYIS